MRNLGDPNRTTTSPKFPKQASKEAHCVCTWHIPLGNNGFHDLHNGQVGFAQWVLDMWSLNTGLVRLGQVNSRRPVQLCFSKGGPKKRSKKEATHENHYLFM
jgi:hypothetical protein